MARSRSFFSTDKSQRFIQRTDATILSSRAYNMVIGGVTAYGLIVNFITCAFFSDGIATINPITLMIAYFISAIVGMLIVNYSHSAIVSFLGYNLVVLPLGALLSVCIRGFSSAIIFQTAGLTGSVVVIMICIAALYPDFVISIGNMLFGAFVILFIIGIITSILHFNLGFYSYAMSCIFSLYIAFDWARANRYQKTLDNAIDSACDIYLDIINLFLNILRIVGKNN